MKEIPHQSEIPHLSIEERFNLAKKIHKENLKRENEAKIKNYPVKQRFLEEVKNSSFRSSREFNYYLMTFCTELGFDISGKSRLTAYSKNYGYYSVSPESSSYNLKERIIKHFNSKFKNVSNNYEFVNGYKKRNKLYNEIKTIFIDHIRSRQIAILYKKYGEFKSSGFKPVRESQIAILKEYYPQYLTMNFSEEELSTIESLWVQRDEYLLKRDKSFKIDIRIDEKKSKIHNALALPSFHKKTNIIAMDLDTHSFPIEEDSVELFNNFAEDIRIYLLNDLRLNIVLFERSKICRGLHIYIKLENIHNKEMIQDILKEIIEERYKKVTVEYRNENKPLRLPFCWDYDNLNVKTGKIISSLTKSLNRCFELLDKPIIESNKDLSRRLSKLKKAFSYNYDEKIWIWGSRRFTTQRKDEFSWDTQITRGNRVAGEGIQWRLLNKCLKYEKSLNDFIDLSIEFKGSSKDLNEWSSSEIIKECSKMYKYAERSFTEAKLKRGKVHENTFYSNADLVTEEEQEILNHFINRIQFSSYNSWNIKKQEEAKIVFREILGSIKWQKENKRKIKENNITNKPVKKQKGMITENKANELLIGYQFSDKYFHKLKSHYNLETNVQSIFNHFKCIFLNLYTHENGSTYIPVLHSCHQWTESIKFNYWFNINNEFNIYNNINIYNNMDLSKYTIMTTGFENRLLRQEEVLRRSRVCGDGIDTI